MDAVRLHWLCHYAGGNFRHPDQSGTVCTVRMVPDRVYSAERCILHCQQHCLLCTDCSHHEEQRRAGRDGFLAFHVRLCHQPAHPVHHAGCCYGIGRWCCRLAHCCNHLRHHRSACQHPLRFLREGTAGRRIGGYHRQKGNRAGRKVQSSSGCKAACW